MLKSNYSSIETIIKIATKSMESDDRSLKQNVSEQLTGGHQQTADPVSWKITSNLSPSYINRVLSRK